MSNRKDLYAMKLMVASDIHGSAKYCRKLITAFENEHPDKLLLLGDILYHGPRNDLPEEYSPKTVIQMLNNIKENILCIRGNCDTDVDQMVLQFPIMAEYCILYVQNRMIFAAHGHNFNEQNLPPVNKNDIVLNGHTHIPACEEILDMNGGKYQYLNPGSVSIPKEGSEHSYMIYENGVFTWKNLAGEEYQTWKTVSHS